MLRHIARPAFSAALSALFAGCASNAAPVPNQAATNPSWMQPEASTSALLYVSDVGTENVYVYTYPGGDLAGKLTGFKEPQGLCSDRMGNVWVVDTQRSRVVEYAHGGSEPIATLEDRGQYPSGCAVDAHGNVAVTNIATTHGGPGSVAFYTGAAGQPKRIASSNFAELYFAAFDASGNLFVDGFPPNFAQAALGEIRHGSGVLVNVPIKGATIEFPGGVEMHGADIDVGDQIDDAIFHIEEDGTVDGVTPLSGVSDCVQGTIVRTTFVCPDSGNGAVEFFRYPAGGSPKRTITGLTEPTGTTISVPR